MVNELKNMNVKALAKELDDMVKNTTPGAAVIVKEYGDYISVVPAKTNFTKSFYHLEKIVDFCRCKGLSCYASYRKGFIEVIIH